VWLAAPEGVFPEELAPDLGLILDSIPEGIYGVDPAGRMILVNRAAARMLGYEPADLIGKVPHDVMHHSHPDGTPYPRHECPLSTAAAEGRAFTNDSDLFWRRDGTTFPVEYESRPMLREGRLIGFLVTFRDITERRRSEERQRELLREQFAKARAEFQYAQLRTVLAQAPAVICVTRGPRHVIDTVNELFRELVGGRDVIGLTIREAFPDADHRRLALMDLAYETGETSRGTELPVEVVVETGTEQRFYSYVFQPLRDDGGAVYGLMTHGVNVTREVRTRQELETRTENIARMAAALKRSNEELDAFAYAASHDLRGPLRGIANLAQWIEEDLTADGSLKADIRDMLALMRSRMHRMEALIEGILQYSRAGRVTERATVVNTRRIVDDVVDLMTLAPSARVLVEGPMPTIESATPPLQQIFMNLIGNALKHGDAAEPLVRIRATDLGDYVQFSVQDNGPGIPKEYHERIWGIFQTLEARDKVEGTGIGLSLVKKLTESQGGRAWVESTPGDGATFHFLWPKRPVDAPPRIED
jgi:PAS domain S-box-containing protein